MCFTTHLFIIPSAKHIVLFSIYNDIPFDFEFDNNPRHLWVNVVINQLEDVNEIRNSSRLDHFYKSDVSFHVFHYFRCVCHFNKHSFNWLKSRFHRKRSVFIYFLLKLSWNQNKVFKKMVFLTLLRFCQKEVVRNPF